jgi:hypothetical protein
MTAKSFELEDDDGRMFCRRCKNIFGCYRCPRNPDRDYYKNIDRGD